ncbi:MAG: polyprenyl synthetase family protein [Deltaproteobacteria bacterium]|nr:polyprenyl synthetase family protein [Deltaproteobacteria bacterium]
MDFNGLIGEFSGDLQQVEKEILHHLNTEIPLLNDVAKHILSSGGKRLRPVILILASRMFQSQNPNNYKAAAAVEFLHTATLLHDDVVDDADLRRQKKTARIVWGNPASVLVGDYLLALSFRMMTELGDLVVLDTISQTTAMMAKGEILQLIRRVDSATPEDYMAIIINKTASLFAAAAKIGGCCGGAGPEHQEALYLYGHDLGIAFQIVDDALDYAQERQRVGKPLGTDLKEHKVTLPLSRLLDVARGEEKSRLLAVLKQEIISDADVEQVVEMMAGHGVMAFTLQEAEKFAGQAVAHLDRLPKGEEREKLRELAGFVVRRDY